MSDPIANKLTPLEHAELRAAYYESQLAIAQANAKFERTMAPLIAKYGQDAKIVMETGEIQYPSASEAAE